MEIYTKHNIYSDFLDQRIGAMESISKARSYRETSPWDRVGAQSEMPHTKEVHKFIQESIGFKYRIVNPKRHFNLCYKNPYNFSHIHYDDYDYIIVIYLNFKGQYISTDGTRIVSHKEDGRCVLNDKIAEDLSEASYVDFRVRESFEDIRKQENAVLNSEYMQEEKWNTDLFIPMVQNKAIMFECRYLHSETSNFGDCVSSGRLVETVYVNKL
jgi:hypothetical protein